MVPIEFKNGPKYVKHIVDTKNRLEFKQQVLILLKFDMYLIIHHQTLIILNPCQYLNRTLFKLFKL